MSSTAEITNAFLQRLGEQDAEGIGELFAEEIDWLVRGDRELFPWAGPRSRKSEVPGYFRDLWAALVPGKSVVAVEAVVVDGDEAVVFGAFDHVAASTGRPFHTDVALRLTVIDGAITRLRLFEDTAAVAAAFAA
ncbi:nuclear transport factor 2 family protein [Puerhibacterium sp. TATVAM-FAB25]|uniref:nuclear transport factor 2 family protein n=1 Tax=Puerhibacterium sp. TATVAM-FAB25 TaxID=3093699 RepID=UPI0039784FAF